MKRGSRKKVSTRLRDGREKYREADEGGKNKQMQREELRQRGEKGDHAFLER